MQGGGMTTKKKRSETLAAPAVTEVAPARKKHIVRKTSKKKAKEKKSACTVVTREMTVEEKTPMTVEIPKTVERVVFIHRCTHCQHVPLGVNVLFTLCFALLVMLSTILLYSMGDLLPSFAFLSSGRTGSVASVTVHP
jgi:hypothetical protein